uniref:Extracellular leucine rich repeat and fibronectin type III domain containing 2 n=1 Tax=Hippocampus comes TaxID=109280 RepID=A0A3Q2XRT9_HIPCM
MALLYLLLLPALLFLRLPTVVSGDCWLIEGDKGYVWLAICSQNQPPYETIPHHINSTVHDLRLNENKLKAVLLTSMYRFTNLTDLNLTKNEISYIEDGAFAGQANLQVLQLGYNKLTNLTEGMLRGLGRMQCLFLQHNLIEVIAANAFWESPSLSSLDLSSNKLARLDPSTFTVLNRLQVCELAGNPFHCGCELYSFLTWLEAFNNVTHTYDRLQCETPRELNGYPLLGPSPGHGRNARVLLSTRCQDGVIIPGISSTGSELDGSGMGLDNPDPGLYHQPSFSSTPDPTYNHQISMKLQTVSLFGASVVVQIPRPYSKMYVLSQYNHTFVADIMPLKNKREVVTLDKLRPHTNYTYCVASVGKSQRYNHTCLSFTTRAVGPADPRSNPSTTTHYIMTILGCLFGMVIILGCVYYCLRRRRIQEEKEKALSVTKTILEMRYGSSFRHAAPPGPGPPPASPRRGGGLPQVEKMASAFSEAMGTKGSYMDVRTAGGAGEARDGETDSDDDGRGSASEISTIAKEVDKVNQIINNCIDALKLDASVNAAENQKPLPPSMAPVPLVMPLSERPGISGGGFLSPPYRDPPPANAVRPLQRQLSADTTVSKNRCGVPAASGPVKSGRLFSADVPEKRGEPPKYPSEKSSPVRSGVGGCNGMGSVNGGGGHHHHHLEVQPDYHSSEHRHSFPALYYEGGSESPSPAQKASFLKPRGRSKRDATAAYSQLSPARHHHHHHYNSGYSSSPEYSSESTLRIWERFRPYKKNPREEASYIAAGHALRKKVQFAKDEDLHDILDYWKGVSAQQKL